MRKPIAIVEVDLGRPLTDLRVEKYESCRVLLKYQGLPLGWVQVKGKNGAVPAAELQRQVIRYKGTDLMHHRMQQQLRVVEPAQTPAISVVVCTRNRAQHLADCLVHLLNLDYPDYEIIVVDNAPADEETRLLTAELPVRYVREDRPGLDHARNRGIAEAHYSIIAFTDDDVRVDKNWLRALANSFGNPEVMAVTGFVAPASLDTFAEQVFELHYGGMGEGFCRRHFHRDTLPAKHLLWSSAMGVGANMAFRKTIFDRVGGFDPALDVGTPTHGGGDIEMFFRVVSSGMLLCYDPAVMVWHRHRTGMAGLRRQVSDNGRGFAAYLLAAWQQKDVSTGTWHYFILVEWFGKWIMKNLVRNRRGIPRKLLLRELAGFFTGPWYWWQSKRKQKERNQLFPSKPRALGMATPANS